VKKRVLGRIVVRYQILDLAIVIRHTLVYKYSASIQSRADFSLNKKLIFQRTYAWVVYDSVYNDQYGVCDYKSQEKVNQYTERVSF
jgi:hypothetical protein